MTKKMQIGMIWAQDRNLVLGSGTDMLWRVPADFKHFKETTIGHPIIMGRNSWEALGRALPGRTNIVLTRQPPSVLKVLPDSVFHDLETCLLTLAEAGEELVWITGGGQVYQEALAYADFLIITDLDLTVTQTGQPLVTAPQIDNSVWKYIAEKSDPDWRERSGDARWKISYYQRKTNQPAKMPLKKS